MQQTPLGCSGVSVPGDVVSRVVGGCDEPGDRSRSWLGVVEGRDDPVAGGGSAGVAKRCPGGVGSAVISCKRRLAWCVDLCGGGIGGVRGGICFAAGHEARRECASPSQLSTVHQLLGCIRQKLCTPRRKLVEVVIE
jgi:hypothetical protein